MTKEELMKRLEESAVAIYEDEGSYDYMFRAIADEVKASDLVEVIRCKDCKYCHTPEPRKWAKRDEHGVFTGEYELIQFPSHCAYYSNEFCEEVDPDKDYCSHAERKEEKQ